MTTPTLPAVLDAYFAALNDHDIDALLTCFAPDAIVRDEGQDIVGTPAIRAWKVEASEKYRSTAQPIRAHAEDGRMAVVATVSGTFPGSPLDLTFRFHLNGESRIDALEIGV